MTGPVLTHILLALTLAAACGAFFAWLLRGAEIWGGRAAAAVVGAVMAGVLLGPHVAGRAAPDLHGRLFVGGQQEQRDVESLRAEHNARVRAFMETDPDPESLSELRESQREQIRPLVDQLNAARARHRFALADLGAALIGLGIVLACWTASASRRGLPTPPVTPEPGRAPELPRPFPAQKETVLGIAVGLGAAVTAGALAALCAWWLLRMPAPAAIAVGAALGTGSALAGLHTRYMPALGRTHAVRCAAAAGALLAAAAASGTMERPWILALLGAALAGSVLRRVAPVGIRARRAARALLLWAIVPGAVGLAAAQIDISVVGAGGWRAWVFIVVAVILATDARWGGGIIAGMLVLRARSDTALRGDVPSLSTEAIASGACITQAWWALVLIAGAAIDPSLPSGAAALTAILLSAAILATGVEAYRLVTRWLHSGGADSDSGPTQDR